MRISLYIHIEVPKLLSFDDKQSLASYFYSYTPNIGSTLCYFVESTLVTVDPFILGLTSLCTFLYIISISLSIQGQQAPLVCIMRAFVAL